MRDDKRTYTNGEVTVYWDPDLCIHVMNCIRSLPEVFNSSKRPWVNVHAAGTKEIIKGVDTCPTGALTWKLNRDIESDRSDKTDKSEESGKVAELTLSKNGPIMLHGDFILLDETGCKIQTPKNIALCRCGNSKNKPFCDSSHSDAGFKS